MFEVHFTKKVGSFFVIGRSETQVDLFHQKISMFFKTIIQGRLDFGTQNSYDKVAKMFQYRIDTYYKNEIIFKSEDIFKPEQLSLEIPRFVGNVSEWTASVWQAYPGAKKLFISEDWCVLRGGGWNSNRDHVSCSVRINNRTDLTWSNDYGFRVVAVPRSH